MGELQAQMAALEAERDGARRQHAEAAAQAERVSGERAALEGAHAAGSPFPCADPDLEIIVCVREELRMCRHPCHCRREAMGPAHRYSACCVQGLCPSQCMPLPEGT